MDPPRRRGRPPLTESSKAAAAERAAVAAQVQAAAAAVPAQDVPEVGGEEVVLNRRGMPARQRKKNRFYYDEETMVTMDTLQKKGKNAPGQGRKSGIKQEPLDEPESDMFAGDLSSEDVGEEVEIPSAVVEEVVTATVRRPGRPPGSGKKNKGSESPPKGRRNDDMGSRKDSGRGSSVGRSPEPGRRGRPEVRKNRDKRNDSSEESEERRPSKTPERSFARHSRGSSRDDTSAETSPVRQVAKIKKEPNTSGASAGVLELMEQRYLDKREKDRLAKERERERKREKERQLKEREREYNSVMPLKSRGKREPSPTDFTSGLMSGSALDEFKQTIDKKTAQDISLRLRNLLKLPKAHKWVCYEWFYSNIDKVLFEGENDFQTCLRESFPLLKARKLTRVEWCKIRRIMGKPRRCSQAFFDEEREELSRRRQKIRMIQQRKITDFNYKELPDEIPLQLTIGTKVTARLRRPQDGLFTGTIEGVDTSNNTYRITFDRAGLGTHSIPDYEVLSNEPVETVSTSSFALKIPRRSFGFGTAAFKFQNPGLIGEDGVYRFPSSPFPEGGMLGGFPIRLLDMIVRLSKLLKAKREKILQLKELNVEAEKMLSYGKPFNTDYRLRYARCVLDLDSMNKEMAMYVEGIQTYCLEQIAPDHGANQLIVPEQVQEQCRQEASLIVDTYNTKNGRRAVQDQKSVTLISSLASLMLQIKTLSTGERNLYELKSIKETIRETKASLEGKNLQLFQNRVEIPMNRIQAGLCIYSKSF